MKKLITILGLVVCGLSVFAATEARDVTVDFAVGVAPALTVYQANEQTFVVTLKNNQARVDLTNRTPVMWWAASSAAASIVTASCSVVSATAGTFRAVFSPTALNTNGSTFVFGVGVRSNNVTTARIGQFSILRDPFASGASPIAYTTPLDWSLISERNGRAIRTNEVDGTTITWDGQLHAVAAEAPDLTARAGVGTLTTNLAAVSNLTVAAGTWTGSNYSPKAYAEGLTNGLIQLGDIPAQTNASFARTGEVMALAAPLTNGYIKAGDVAADNLNWQTQMVERVSTNGAEWGSHAGLYPSSNPSGYVDRASATQGMQVAGAYLTNGAVGVSFDSNNTATNIYGGAVSVLGTKIEGYGRGMTVQFGNSTAYGNAFVYGAGMSVASNNYSVAMGVECVALGGAEPSFALGYFSRAIHNGSFVWGYDGGISHGAETFNIKPTAGLSGFFVGDTTMQSYLDAKVATNDARYLAALTNSAAFDAAGAAAGITNGLPSGTNMTGSVFVHGRASSIGTLAPWQDYASITNPPVLDSFRIWNLWSGSNSTVMSGAQAMRTLDYGAAPLLTNVVAVSSNGQYIYYCSLPAGLTQIKQDSYEVDVTMWRSTGGGDAVSISAEIYVRQTNGTLTELTAVSGTEAQAIGSTPLMLVYRLTISSNTTLNATDSLVLAFKTSGMAGSPTLYIMSGQLSVPVPSTQYVLQSEFQAATNRLMHSLVLSNAAPCSSTFSAGTLTIGTNAASSGGTEYTFLNTNQNAGMVFTNAGSGLVLIGTNVPAGGGGGVYATNTPTGLTVSSGTCVVSAANGTWLSLTATTNVFLTFDSSCTNGAMFYFSTLQLNPGTYTVTMDTNVVAGSEWSAVTITASSVNKLGFLKSDGESKIGVKKW